MASTPSSRPPRAPTTAAVAAPAALREVGAGARASAPSWRSCEPACLQLRYAAPTRPRPATSPPGRAAQVRLRLPGARWAGGAQRLGRGGRSAGGRGRSAAHQRDRGVQPVAHAGASRAGHLAACVSAGGVGGESDQGGGRLQGAARRALGMRRGLLSSWVSWVHGGVTRCTSAVEGLRGCPLKSGGGAGVWLVTVVRTSVPRPPPPTQVRRVRARHRRARAVGGGHRGAAAGRGCVWPQGVRQGGEAGGEGQRLWKWAEAGGDQALRQGSSALCGARAWVRTRACGGRALPAS